MGNKTVMTVKRQRDVAMDAIAGLLIVYMVLVHLFQYMGIYSGKVLFYMLFF